MESDGRGPGDRAGRGLRAIADRFATFADPDHIGAVLYIAVKEDQLCRPPGAELLVDLALIGPVLLGAQVVVVRILIAVVEEGAREKVIEGELQHPPPQLDRYGEIGRGRPGERNRPLGPEETARKAVHPRLG